jgi:murein DD-endopeptidase MepM/ murein hydrolase activator NlpD
MELLKALSNGQSPIPILDDRIPTSEYCPIDLSISNTELKAFDISNAEECQHYVGAILKKNNAKVAYGGYLEKRNLYGISERFQENVPRNIHLGMDFWCDAGTTVIAPLDGVVHSYANNSDFGNYGPTILLIHEINGHTFYSLYGHLSLESLNAISIGKAIDKGDAFASLGTSTINVGYAPHLHFQLILDLGMYQGDYPGVCSESDLEYFAANCPDPNLMLGYHL